MKKARSAEFGVRKLFARRAVETQRNTIGKEEVRSRKPWFSDDAFFVYFVPFVVPSLVIARRQ